MVSSAPDCVLCDPVSVYSSAHRKKAVALRSSSEEQQMRCLYLLRPLVFIAAITPLFSGPNALGFQTTQTQSVNSTANVDDQPNIEVLLQNLYASIQDGKSSYEAMRIVSQIGQLGPDASPAVDILIELLGKPLAECDEALRVCPNNERSCAKESKICPTGAEMHKYDYLTLSASYALRRIGVAALPRLSVALGDTDLSEESLSRRRLVAEVMGSIGPAAVPFLSDVLRVSDYSNKRLALEALHAILSRDPSSGDQLTSFVPYITPFLDGDFETTDRAIDVLGAIGPGAAQGVPRLTQLLGYKRVLAGHACPVGERTGYIFQAKTKDALMKIGTPEAVKAVEQLESR